MTEQKDKLVDFGTFPDGDKWKLFATWYGCFVLDREWLVGTISLNFGSMEAVNNYFDTEPQNDP